MIFGLDGYTQVVSAKLYTRQVKISAENIRFALESRTLSAKYYRLSVYPVYLGLNRGSEMDPKAVSERYEGHKIKMTRQKPNQNGLKKTHRICAIEGSPSVATLSNIYQCDGMNSTTCSVFSFRTTRRHASYSCATVQTLPSMVPRGTIGFLARPSCARRVMPSSTRTLKSALPICSIAVANCAVTTQNLRIFPINLQLSWGIINLQLSWGIPRKCFYPTGKWRGDATPRISLGGMETHSAVGGRARSSCGCGWVGRGSKTCDPMLSEFRRGGAEGTRKGAVCPLEKQFGTPDRRDLVVGPKVLGKRQTILNTRSALCSHRNYALKIRPIRYMSNLSKIVYQNQRPTSDGFLK